MKIKMRRVVRQARIDVYIWADKTWVLTQSKPRVLTPGVAA